ncbi:MAG: tetratricopeptide repeat protein [Bacteroidetes bacterium]|jgi:hypothetical protein|nr:tetratricopeptide repeat protein [Bacteroidota bacterium]
MNVNDPNLPNPFLILLVFSITLAVVRVFTTMVHEMGHALVGVMFLKGDFDIYIGSYGDPEKGYHFKLWRFKFHLNYQPFSIEKGVFKSEQQETTYLKDFLVTLGGPIASLFTAGICIYLAVFSSLPEIIKMAFYILTGSSFLDFWYNIKPSTEPVELHNGTIVYNDGYILKYRWSQMFGRNAQPEETEVEQIADKNA